MVSKISLMNFRKILCFWLFPAVALGTLQAQRSGISIKLYGHALVLDARTLLGFDQREAALVTFGGLAPAILFQSENGLYQELELSRLYYEDVQEGSEPFERGSLSLRYEAGYSPQGRRNPKMRYRFGMSLSGYTYFYSNFTGGFDAYPIDQDGTGWVLSLTPHLEMSFTKNLFLDFSPFLDIANFGVRREFEYNPDFEDEQIDSIDFLFSSFSPRLRAGLGWRF